MKSIKYKNLKEGDLFIHFFTGEEHKDIFIAKYIGVGGEASPSIVCHVYQHLRSNRITYENSWCVRTLYYDSVEAESHLTSKSTYHNFDVEAFLLEPDEVLAFLSEQL